MLFVADLHLGDSADCIELEDGISSKVADTANRLKEIIRKAASLDESVVLGGDVFDSNTPKPYVISTLFGLFAYAKKKKVTIHIIPGNHDCDVRWNSLIVAEAANYENVVLYSRPCLAMIDHVDVLMFPHIPKRLEASLLEGQSYEDYISSLIRKSKTTVMISHADLFGFPHSDEQEMEASNALSFDTNKLPQLRGLLLGHIHQASCVLHSKYKYPIAYSGSVVPHSFGEGDDSRVSKSYIHFSDEHGYEEIEYETPIKEYKTIKINALKGFKITKEVKDKILTLHSNKLLKLVIHCNDRAEVNELQIREAFNQRDTRVLRIEYVFYQKGKVTFDTATTDAIFSDIDHVSLLEAYLKELDISDLDKKRTLDLGREVIESCLI